ASAAQFNTEKLNWLNQQYLKTADDAYLADEVTKRLARRGVTVANDAHLQKVVALYKERAVNLNELADAVEPVLVELLPSDEMKITHFTEAGLKALQELHGKLEAAETWEKAVLNQCIKDTCTALSVKMPAVAIPLRVALLGLPQSPSIDAVLEVLGRDAVFKRLGRFL
ncbi:MAG TPA: glutamate--tRNA ligase, partial [Rhodocyclaceae bacterium]|nr:glutamate--tRNA ligase [Rhodocyclaceae bacterium]